MPGTDDEYAQINLRWCNKNIRSIFCAYKINKSSVKWYKSFL